MLELLAAPAERVTFVHAAAQDLENSQNPLRWRAARAARWLATVPRSDTKAQDLAHRTGELMALGFGNFDALHVASAGLANCDVLITTDDQLIALSQRHATLLHVRVVGALTLAREVFQ